MILIQSDDLRAMLREVVDEALAEHKPQTTLISRHDLAELTNTSLSTVDRNARKGVFRRIEIGGKVFFNLGEVQQRLAR